MELKYHFNDLIKNNPAGICLVEKGEIIYCNNTFENLFDRNKKGLLGRKFINLIKNKSQVKLKKAFMSEMKIKLEFWVEFDDCRHWFYAGIKNNFSSKGTITYITVLDITEKKKKEEEKNFLNYHDKLTGLYNRYFFEAELNRLDVKRYLPLSIIIGDVNNLKLINDAFGHQKGDSYLREIARALKRSLRDEDIISRWGGDEFGIILPSTSLSCVKEICNRIKNECFNCDKFPISLSIALGVAVKEEPETEIDKVFKQAEKQMYQNKIEGDDSRRRSILKSLLNSLKNKSLETEEHIARLTKLLNEFAQELDLSSDKITELKRLAKMHDMGKIAVSEKILKKPGILNQKEFEKVKSHSEKGYRIIKEIPELAAIAELILTHHEAWDGSGYPRGLTGKEIPYKSRVFAIVEAFEVMTSERVYREKYSTEKAVAEIKKDAGHKFDPDLVQKFINFINQREKEN